MGVHQLVTGLNGAGKSLYSIATKLAPLVERDSEGKPKVTINYKGRDIPRRLVVGGIPDLALEHELMEVPEIDVEEFVDLWRKVDRRGGEPPVRWLVRRQGGKGEADYFEACDEDTAGAEPVVHSFVCWWLWVEPGDFVVVDEAQRVFRPMASGRRVPRFIARLETARHYGIELLYLTQFPNLLHSNVRSLCGPHEDVQRIFGSSRVVVYLWERTSSVTATGKATKRFWKHDPKAFKLYKSSELHTNFRQPLPFALYAAVAAVVGLLVVGYVLRERLAQRFSAPVAAAPSAAASMPVAAVAADVAAAARARYFERFPLMRDLPRVEGCYSVGELCRCQSAGAQPVAVSLALCRASVKGYGGVVAWEPRLAPLAGSYGSAASSATSTPPGNAPLLQDRI